MFPCRRLFLVDPVMLLHLPLCEILLGEPESDLLLGRLNSIGAVAYVAADVLEESSLVGARKHSLEMEETYDGEVTTNSTWRRGERVCGTEKGAPGLDDFFTFPNHGADWTAGHI